MTATARRPRTPRRGALKAAPRAGESAPDLRKTLLGSVSRNAAPAVPRPVPVPAVAQMPSGPHCGWCGASGRDEPVLVANWDTHSDGPLVRCKHVRACARRYLARLARSPQTASTGAADHAPAPVLEQALQGAQTALEPLPEMTP